MENSILNSLVKIFTHVRLVVIYCGDGGGSWKDLLGIVVVLSHLAVS